MPAISSWFRVTLCIPRFSDRTVATQNDPHVQGTASCPWMSTGHQIVELPCELDKSPTPFPCRRLSIARDTTGRRSRW